MPIAGHHDAAEDRVQQPALALRCRRRLREHADRPAAEALRRPASRGSRPRIARPKNRGEHGDAERDRAHEPPPAQGFGHALLLVAPRSSLISRSRAPAITTNVSTNRIRPSAINDGRVQVADRLREFVRDRRGDRRSRREQRRADPVRVADHECHGHGFAERAAETEHDAADDAGSRPWQHDVPDDIPLRRAGGVGGFFERRRRHLKHFAHHRGDERQHHDREHDAGGQETDAIRRALEQRADRPAAGPRGR